MFQPGNFVSEKKWRESYKQTANENINIYDKNQDDDIHDEWVQNIIVLENTKTSSKEKRTVIFLMCEL